MKQETTKPERPSDSPELGLHSVSGSSVNENCKHEYQTFVDRVDKSRQIWCCKCGKDYEGRYSKRM